MFYLNAMTRKWEEIDHDLEDSAAGVFTSGSGEGEGDPLGLGAYVKYVCHLLEVIHIAQLIASSVKEMDMESSGWHLFSYSIN